MERKVSFTSDVQYIMKKASLYFDVIVNALVNLSNAASVVLFQLKIP